MKNVLGIETSCDETAAALAADGRCIRAGVVASQVALHAPYGGVVPEIAARQHLEQLPCVISQTMEQAGADWNDLQAIAVTYGPGLATSLLAGIAAAKGLALRLRVPLIGINHIEAHLYSIFLAPDAPEWQEALPMTALLVSGGHTCLLRVTAPGEYQVLGATLDDAAGEAFDKGAQLLGLGYPGGPAIEQAAATGDPNAIKFPRGIARQKHNLNYSFSGLKTALRYYLEKVPRPIAPEHLANIAASYQEAIVDALTIQAVRAASRAKTPTLAVAGGVSINTRLRARLREAAAAQSLRLLLAPAKYCGDNAAMVAGLAAAGRGLPVPSIWNLDAEPNLRIGA